VRGRADRTDANIIFLKKEQSEYVGGECIHFQLNNDRERGRANAQMGIRVRRIKQSKAMIMFISKQQVREPVSEQPVRPLQRTRQAPVRPVRWQQQQRQHLRPVRLRWQPREQRAGIRSSRRAVASQHRRSV
jgi:hypothetical protein